MSVRSPASDLFPVAAVGVAILALGGLLLLIGAGTSVGDPSEFDTWLVGVGLVLLLGAMLVVLIRAGPPPSKKPAPAAAPATPAPTPATPAPLPTRTVVDAAPPATTAPSTEAPEAAPAGVPARVPAGFPGSTSIPAQYEGARRDSPRSPGSEMAWDEGAIGMSLPFAAGPTGGTASTSSMAAAPSAMSGPAVSAPFAPIGFLEMEVERLRERVHELERTGPRVPRGPVPTPPPRAGASGLSAIAPRRDGVRPPEPPAPNSVASRRLCTGCGTGLPGGATDPLCWGCGRPLCSTCYWRAKDGASAHTCPACFARAGSTALSGGRGPPDAPTSVAANPRPNRATPAR